jgi:hypothetical protein
LAIAGMVRAAPWPAARVAAGGGIGAALAGLAAGADATASCFGVARALTASLRAALCAGAFAAAGFACGFATAALPVVRLAGCVAAAVLALPALALAAECVSFRAIGFWAAFLLATLGGAIFCAMSFSLYIGVPISCPGWHELELERPSAAAELKAGAPAIATASSEAQAVRLKLYLPAGIYRWLPTDRSRFDALRLQRRRILMLCSGKIATPAIVRSRSARA